MKAAKPKKPLSAIECANLLNKQKSGATLGAVEQAKLDATIAAIAKVWTPEMVESQLRSMRLASDALAEADKRRAIKYQVPGMYDRKTGDQDNHALIAWIMAEIHEGKGDEESALYLGKLVVDAIKAGKHPLIRWMADTLKKWNSKKPHESSQVLRLLDLKRRYFEKHGCLPTKAKLRKIAVEEMPHIFQQYESAALSRQWSRYWKKPGLDGLPDDGLRKKKG